MATAAKELLVQMQINRSNATAGGSGANIAASALMSVLVTHNGAPMANLGANAGDGQSAINLPAGWTLYDDFNVRPGGSDVSVTQFINQGSGIYDIRIVPFVNNPACIWLSGEYIYALSISVKRSIHGKVVALRGSALGKLTIL